MSGRKTLRIFAAIFALTLALRLCHRQLLWPDEDYHLAAAIQLLRGKILYRDFWYDKPPLSALTYAVIGAPTGWALRVFDSLWILAICAAAYRLVREMWSEAEGLIAAGFAAFFLNFDLPGGIIPVAPDFFMVLPHLLAMWCAWRLRPLAAGGWCGIAFLFNPKGVFVLATCGILLWRSVPALAIGFLVPNIAAMATLAAQGAAGQYFEQVWKWGLSYARSAPAASTAADGFRRVGNWLGFHAALVFGSCWFWWKEKSRAVRFVTVWAVVSLAGVASGGRYSNRYFLELLPVLVVGASRGMTLAFERKQRLWAVTAIVAIALGVPFGRFGPRYATLAFDLMAGRESKWADTALDRDSRAVAEWLSAHKRAGETLFVWGYRPDVFAYTRMPVAGLFWDSQPLTGVPADRHLSESVPIVPEWAAANRRELIASHPDFIVDGLSRLNTRLDLSAYSETREWLGGYELVHNTPLSLVYKRTGR